jgi:hypothetical protein
MAGHSPTPISDNCSTADPDAALVALVEKRFATWRLFRDVDDDDADAAYDEMDRLDVLITATPARTLAAIHLKATVCHHIARGDVELAWPMLCSLMADLQRVPLDDQTMLRSIFAELATISPPRWTPDHADENL